MGTDAHIHSQVSGAESSLWRDAQGDFYWIHFQIFCLVCFPHGHYHSREALTLQTIITFFDACRVSKWMECGAWSVRCMPQAVTFKQSLAHSAIVAMGHGLCFSPLSKLLLKQSRACISCVVIYFYWQRRLQLPRFGGERCKARTERFKCFCYCHLLWFFFPLAQKTWCKSSKISSFLIYSFKKL